MENPPLVLRQPWLAFSLFFWPSLVRLQTPDQSARLGMGSEAAGLQARTCGVRSRLRPGGGMPLLSVLGGESSKHTFTCSHSWDQRLEEKTRGASRESNRAPSESGAGQRRRSLEKWHLKKKEKK